MAKSAHRAAHSRPSAGERELGVGPKTRPINESAETEMSLEDFLSEIGLDKTDLNEQDDNSNNDDTPPFLLNELGMPSKEWLQWKFRTKSAAIRYCWSTMPEPSVKHIAKHLGFRYQHVRNVLSRELKRGPNEHFNMTEGVSRGLQSFLTGKNPS